MFPPSFSGLPRRRLIGFSLGALACVAAAGIASAQSRGAFAEWETWDRAERARFCLSMRKSAGYFTKGVSAVDKRFIQSQFRGCLKAAASGGRFASFPSSRASSLPSSASGAVVPR